MNKIAIHEGMQFYNMLPRYFFCANNIMPTHYGGGGMRTGGGMKPKKPMSVNEMLKEADKHHSKKHMGLMRDLIKNGISFNKAHSLANKYVGK